MGVTPTLIREVRKLSSEDECREAWDLVKQRFKTIRGEKSAKAIAKLSAGMNVKVDLRGRSIKTKVEKVNLSTVTVKLNGQLWRIHASHVKPA